MGAGRRLTDQGVAGGDADRDAGEDGLAGRTMQLFSVEDGVAVLVAETTTDRNGSYAFDVADGIGPGTYRVREVVPPGWQQTTADPDDADVLALALHLKLPVWTNDDDVEDSGAEWHTTAELLKMLGIKSD